jgi:hypothetical protein
MIALASLSESARKIALDRFGLLQPHFEDKRLLKVVAQDAGIGYRIAQRLGGSNECRADDLLWVAVRFWNSCCVVVCMGWSRRLENINPNLDET